MINVDIKVDKENFIELSISGHALFDKAGKDIVCAGVSAIIFGLCNALYDYDNNIKAIKKENEIKVVIKKPNIVTNTMIKTCKIQLLTIEEVHSKYIKIKEMPYVI